MNSTNIYYEHEKKVINTIRDKLKSSGFSVESEVSLSSQLYYPFDGVVYDKESNPYYVIMNEKKLQFGTL